METLTLYGERIVLTPLRASDADEMASVLDDARLHAFTGGHPLALPALRERYAKLVAGSPDKTTAWLNWIMRVHETGVAIGTMQATVIASSASVAWIVGAAWQGQGFATESARCVVDWLTSQNVRTLRANIHPDHRASETVATRAGFVLTSAWEDGERVWAR
jgi:RimJ/RimL family protein N-acetyltransferase